MFLTSFYLKFVNGEKLLAPIGSSSPTVPIAGATAHRWAMEGSRGAVVDQNEFGGAEADHRPLTKINIYRKLQKI